MPTNETTSAGSALIWLAVYGFAVCVCECDYSVCVNLMVTLQLPQLRFFVCTKRWSSIADSKPTPSDSVNTHYS